MNIKLAADEHGKLLALWGNNYEDHGPYSEFGDLLTMRLSHVGIMVACMHYTHSLSVIFSYYFGSKR